MTIQVRDAAGTLRSVASIQVRDAAGTLRSVASIQVRDAAGTLRSAYSSAPPPAPAGAYITPESSSTSSQDSASFTRSFTVSYSGAATYAWGVDGGTIVSGGAAQTASIRVSASAGESQFASIWCDVTISGTTTRIYASMEHAYYPRTL